MTSKEVEKLDKKMNKALRKYCAEMICSECMFAHYNHELTDKNYLKNGMYDCIINMGTDH